MVTFAEDGKYETITSWKTSCRILKITAVNMDKNEKLITIQQLQDELEKKPKVTKDIIQQNTKVKLSIDTLGDNIDMDEKTVILQQFDKKIKGLQTIRQDEAAEVNMNDQNNIRYSGIVTPISNKGCRQIGR